jgi:molybdopterin converting factor subunit 1
MNVNVQLFAGMRQQFRSAMLALEVPEGSRIRFLKAELQRRFSLPWPAGAMWAVNQEYVDEDTVLHESDEVAVIPPVSGG